MSTLKALADLRKYAESVRQIKKITLKAFANFSPGFALKPWGTRGTYG
jgi:hypothetical protein